MKLFGLQPGLVGVFVVVEFVVRVACFVQILEGCEDLTRSDLFLLFVSLVLPLPLQLDGYHTPFCLVGQPRQLLDSVHDVGGSDWYADHSSLACSPARVLKKDDFLKIQGMGHQIILQFGQNRAVGMAKLQPVGHSHGRDVAFLEGALTGGAEVGEIADRGDKMAVPSLTGVFDEFKSLLRFSL